MRRDQLRPGEQTPSNPPDKPVAWMATIRKSSGPLTQVTVTARTWFVAREMACKLLGCEPHEVSVTLERK